ncbi:MAG: aminopeptidase [Acidobacteriota bacterium]
MDRKLMSAARIAIKCLAPKKGESLIVITDEPLRLIGQAIFKAATELGVEPVMVEITPRERNGDEPPPKVAEMWKRFDLFLAPTSKSLTHTKARREACEAGARGGTLPGIKMNTMLRALNADFTTIAKRSQKVAKVLSAGKMARVFTPTGTDITMSIKGRMAKADTGQFFKKGDYGNLPAGEAFLAPVEGTANGCIVIDGAMAGIGLVKEPIVIKVKKGFATKIDGGREASQLKKMMKPLGENAYNVAELGVGTNDKAKLIGSILEDEKVMGTVHIAFGNNMSMGGKVNVPLHVDGILLKPTLEIDGKLVMKNGELLVK